MIKRTTILHIILSPFILIGWFDFLIRSGLAIGRGACKRHMRRFLGLPA